MKRESSGETLVYRPERPRSRRRRAKEILAVPGVRMSMILATMCFLTFWVGTLYLIENTWYAINWNTLYGISQPLYYLCNGLVYLTDAAVVVLIGLPLSYGWFRYLFLAATAALPPYSVLFSAFGSKRLYWRSIAVTIRCLLRVALPYAAAWVLVKIAQWTAAFGGVVGGILMVLFAVAAGLALFIGTLVNAGATVVFYLDIRHEDESIGTLFARARAQRQGRRVELWLCCLSLLPTFCLGILSLGILLLYHAVPCAAVTMQQEFSVLTDEPLPAVSLAPDPPRSKNQQ